MGRKIGLRVNPKKFAASEKPCLKEFVALLGCIAINPDDGSNCNKHKELLMTCMEYQKNKPKNQWSTINYHLRRLSKQL